MTRRHSVIVFTVSGFPLPSEIRNVGKQDIDRMREKFQDKTAEFHDLELIDALTSDRAVMRRKGESFVQKELKSLFARPGISLFIVYYTGHGKHSGKGYWSLPDQSRFTLEQILGNWSECSQQNQKLLLIMDSCYSGCNVDKLNRYHRKGHYLNVEIIAASHGEAKYNDFGDIGSDLTKELCRDGYCPVSTVCTHSLKSNLSEFVVVTKRNRFKKFEWKLSKF